MLELLSVVTVTGASGTGKVSWLVSYTTTHEPPDGRCLLFRTWPTVGGPVKTVLSGRVRGGVPAFESMVDEF